MKTPKPYSLRTEYLENPIGIDAASPRFSWLSDHPERAQRQSAYRIITASDLGKAEAETGDLWDSGKVVSDAGFNIPYAGASLKSGGRCFWRVKWWDKAGRESAFSDPAFFEMGLLEESDWKARWIGKKDCREFKTKGSVMQGQAMEAYVHAQTIYLRKEFGIKKSVKRARAYVCGLGFYELRLNGRKVGDCVLDPAQTDYKKTALYSTYDITDRLQENNAIGVILGNGRHIKNYGYGHPRLIAQLEIDFEDGGRETIVTEDSWKVSYGPLQKDGIYFGELYDARLEMPGWDEPGFDDPRWENAVSLEGPGLAAQTVQPIRINERLKPKRLYSPEPVVYICDFGQNFTGWVRMTVRGPRGTEVRLRHAELVHEDGGLNVAPNQNAEATDVYILKGEGLEVYEPRFTYHGFRYLEVTGYPGVPSPEDFEGCFVHTDVARTGDFHCSNELINRIHQNVLRGQLSNLMSVPTDCPQRDERYGWMGDAALAAEESLFNFDMAAFYTKYLEDIRLSQTEEGGLPDTVPWYLERLYPADPAWGSAYITLAWLMYRFYGDTRLLEQHFEPMKRYVEFLGRNADGHIQRKLGKYGDWCPPGSVIPKKTPVELTSTWCYYHDTLRLSQMAETIGKKDDALQYAALAVEIEEAFNREFLLEDQYAAHRLSPVDKGPNQTSNALPLYLDMVPAEKKERVLQKLLESVVENQDCHLDTGIIGSRYILDVLTDNGYPDIAYKIAAQRTYPGWGYMVEEGATTLWERWEKITGGGMNSHNHIMLGSVDAWFYRAVAGVAPLAPGWRLIRFRPPLFPGLAFASASLRTILGDVRFSWERSDRLLRMTVRVPVGAEAEIEIPIFGKKMVIRESGKTVWENGRFFETGGGDIACLGKTAHTISFRTGSGQYAFEVETFQESGDLPGGTGPHSEFDGAAD
jgi:alpha-L-rhamnosidase